MQGGCQPGQMSPLRDSPPHVTQGGSLLEVLEVLGLPGCPKERKRQGHCRGGFFPLGAWPPRGETQAVPVALVSIYTK